MRFVLSTRRFRWASLHIQLAVNYRNGNKGIDVRDTDGNVIFDLNIGGDVYSVNNTGGGTDILFNNTYVRTRFLLFTSQPTATGGTWTIAEVAGDWNSVRILWVRWSCCGI